MKAIKNVYNPNIRIMKMIKHVGILFIYFFSVVGMTQESNKDKELAKDTSEVKVDKSTYYKQRGIEDAKFEQQFKADNDTEEKEFWKEQKAYEKDLKKRDKKAYKSYKEGKEDSYRAHYNHCDHHCHHSDYYYHHATYYYAGYHNHYYYERHPRYRRSRGTSVRINTPSLRLGF